MTTDIVTTAVKENARTLSESPVLLDASTALATIPEALTIESDEQDAAWGDVAKKAARGAKHVESSLTDLFRPMKAFEKLLRDHFRTAYVEPLTKGVAKIDRASLAYRQEKQRAAEAERLAAERAAREAAEAAALEASERAREAAEAAAQGIELPQETMEFDDAPGVAQVVVAPVEKIVRSEETTTFERRTLVCVLESESEARKAWPGAFLFDERACIAAFKAEGEHGQRELDAGIVVGGVRFKNDITIQRRDR